MRRSRNLRRGQNFSSTAPAASAMRAVSSMRRVGRLPRLVSQTAIDLYSLPVSKERVITWLGLLLPPKSMAPSLRPKTAQ